MSIPAGPQEAGGGSPGQPGLQAVLGLIAAAALSR